MVTLFEYFEFIALSTTHTLGTLLADYSNAFFSFSQLIGYAYFRKHKAIFLPAFLTPAILFNSLLNNGEEAQSHHSTWLTAIREKILV